MARPLIFLFIIFSLSFLIVSSFLSSQMIQAGKEYKNEMSAYTDVLSFKDRLLSGREWFLGERETRERQNIATEKLNSATLALERQNRYSDFFVIFSLLFVATAYLVFHKHPDAALISAVVLVVLAAFCLVNGIFVPMLEISAFNQDLKIPIVVDVPFLRTFETSKDFSGRMYYYYENKSVVDLIRTLFIQKNYLVGSAILLFSIFIPAVKVLLSLTMLGSHKFRGNSMLQAIMATIGKWSMADVFVAAAFLAYLSFNNMNAGIETEANSLLGLNYFFAYCLFSIVSTSFIGRTISSEERVVRQPVAEAI